MRWRSSGLRRSTTSNPAPAIQADRTCVRERALARNVRLQQHGSARTVANTVASRVQQINAVDLSGVLPLGGVLAAGAQQRRRVLTELDAQHLTDKQRVEIGR